MQLAKKNYGQLNTRVDNSTPSAKADNYVKLPNNDVNLFTLRLVSRKKGKGRAKGGGKGKRGEREEEGKGGIKKEKESDSEEDT